MLSKSKFNNLDKMILWSVSLLILIGIIMIATAKHAVLLDSHTNKIILSTQSENFSTVKMQIIWTVLSVGVLIATLMFDYRLLKEHVLQIYILNFILLIAVLIPGIGQIRGGARRWIGIGSMNMQPSELAKVLLVIVGAYFLEKHKEELNEPRVLLKLALILFFPIALVFKQPHLSGSIILFCILISLFFIAGVKFRYFTYAGLFGVSLAYPIYRFVLEDYQRSRVLAALNPEKYELTKAFQTNQSITAIGSGMQYGKGIGAAGISLPEGHTDFIFGMVGAQLGFLGCVLVIVLFLLLVYRCILIAMGAKEAFDAYLVTGIAAMWGFQAFFNMGVTLGVLPNTGVPLPFVSYGGSSLLIQMLCVGLVLNVGIRNQKTMF